MKGTSKKIIDHKIAQSSNFIVETFIFSVMPILIGKFKLHETTVNVGITTTVGIGLFASAFSKSLFPDFYFAYMLTFMRICQYSAGR